MKKKSKLIGSYRKTIMTRDEFVDEKFESFKEQLKKFLPEEAYQLEFEDIFNQVRELLC